MSDEPLLVRCPACSQKYRVSRATVGQKARCKKCQTSFRIGAEPALDDDTIVAWVMSDGDPGSGSVMGSTSLFPVSAAPAEERVEEPRPRTVSPPAVRLVRIDDRGAEFAFRVAALASEELRNSFPRKCVGCTTREHLEIHLIYWPEKMTGVDPARWQAREDHPVARLDGFPDPEDKSVLAHLPTLRDVAPPFHLPFPVFACRFCHVSKEVEGHVVYEGGHAVCHLLIASLPIAVEFYRRNGGRDTPEYHRLVEARDTRRDPWRELDAETRHRISQWFEPKGGEKFVRLFRDAEFGVTDMAHGGIVLTDRRLVFKKYAAHRDYRLDEPCRLEIRPQADHVVFQLLEEGHRPAIFMLDRRSADDLTSRLRTLRCMWRIER